MEREAIRPEGREADQDIDLDLLLYVQPLTPAERLRRHENALELVQALRAAGIRYHGTAPHVSQDAQ